MSAIEEAAMRYAATTAEIRRLTRKLGEFDENGEPLLGCSRRVVDERTQTSQPCRKWTYEGDGWESARERADWCDGCVAIQVIVDQRRAAKRRRASALSAIGNMARAMLRKATIPEASQ